MGEVSRMVTCEFGCDAREETAGSTDYVVHRCDNREGSLMDCDGGSTHDTLGVGHMCSILQKLEP